MNWHNVPIRTFEKDGKIEQCVPLDYYAEARAAALKAGICQTCLHGAPEPYGCFDCQNTGWEQGMDPWQWMAELNR